MTVTEAPESQQHDTDVHGDFRYTLRVFLLMRRHARGGEWEEVLADVDKEQRHHPDWDTEAKDTYMNWERWYRQQ